MQLSDKKRALLEKLMQQEGLVSEVVQSIPRINHSGIAPMSFSQERLWFLNQLQPESPVYNFPAAVRLKGAFDVRAMQDALNFVVHRHDILRAAFADGEHGPVQTISPEHKLDLPEVDFRSLPEAEREREAMSYANRELQRPFDLMHPPLLRACILRLKNDEVIFLLVLHHIIAEGWSVAILFRELEANYSAIFDGNVVRYPESALQYADFAAWQRKRVSGAYLDSELAFWKEHLGSDLPVLQLPTDRSRPAVQTLKGAWVSHILPKKLYDGLCSLSQQQGATLFMTLLTGYLALLSKYSGQEDIVVGSPVAGRVHAEAEGLIGLFVNTLALRIDLSGNPPFSELLNRVKEVSLAAFSHQEIPFEKLVEEIQPDRSLGSTPLFQVMFALQNSPAPSLNLSGQAPGQPLTPNEIHNGSSKVDQALFVEETSAGLAASFEYNTDLFDRSTVERMLAQYEVLLSGALANPYMRLSELPVLTNEEHRKSLFDWNANKCEVNFEKCVHEYVAAHAKHTPDAIAVVSEGNQLSYSELNKRANQLAHQLQKLGVGPEVLVGICCERDLTMLVAMLGVLKAGGAYLPLDPAYPQDRIHFMVSDANVSVLLSVSHLAGSLPEGKHEVLFLDTDWSDISKYSQVQPETSVTADNLAYVIYTSGSTGRPKGVCIPHSGLLNLVFWHNDAFDVKKTDRATQMAATAFDASVWEVWPYLVAGASLFLTPAEILLAPEALRDWLLENHITISFVPTPLVASLLKQNWPEKSAMKKLLTGGDKLNDFPGEGLPFSLTNNYGPTENTVVSTSCLVSEHDKLEASPSIGRAITNTDIYLLDKHLNPVPIGATGEICMGGASLARGYLNRAGLTAEKFIPHPISKDSGARLYRSGDLGRYLSDGRIEFLGRMDDQVKVRGFRIELGEIEAVLAKNVGIESCVVSVFSTKAGDKRLIAYVVAANGHELVVDEVRQAMTGQLPAYMIPANFLLLKALPLTPNGKVDRKALPAPGNEGSKPGQEQSVASSAIEKVLLGIWSEVLDVKQINIHDNFFELGGHSLMITQLLSRIRRVFRVDLSLRVLFESATIALMAQAIEETEESPGQLEKIAEMLLKIQNMSPEEKKNMLQRKRAEGSIS